MRSAPLIILAAAALAACGGSDQQVAETFDPDTATPGVDTAPAGVASGIAVVFTGDNIFALLDTAYAAAAEHARLAQDKAASAELRTFAEQARARHQSARQELALMATEYSISPILPDEDVLGEQREATAELRRMTGAEFDRAYVERSLRVHEELLDRVEDAADDTRNRTIAEFLRAQQRKLATEVEALRALRDSAGGR